MLQESANGPAAFPRPGHPALYAAFDVYPSSKGAATHISHAARQLFDYFGGGLLYTLGDDDLPLYQPEGRVDILRYFETGEVFRNFLTRALAFRARVARAAATCPELIVCQFRDPWGGMALLDEGTSPDRVAPRGYRTVYEINGLPSIEMPLARPLLGAATLARLRQAERFCWNRADHIVTPSYTLRENLVRLGAPAERITVIPNGATVPARSPRPPAEAPGNYLLYFGALQSWQGVDTLLRAFATLTDHEDLRLVICSSVRMRQAKVYRRLARKLGLGERVLWKYRLRKPELARWISGARFTLAPLAENERNLDQGCSPLKILESMALGVPVLASDLPVVREIIRHRENGWLTRPDRPAELAREIRIMLAYPDEVKRLGAAARATIQRDFTWRRNRERSEAVYAALTGR